MSRRKGKIFLACVWMMIGLCLNGCSASLPDYSDEDYAQITKYAAKLLLKYNKNDNSRLVSEEELLEKEKKDKEKEEKRKEIEKNKEELKKQEEQKKEEEKKENAPTFVDGDSETSENLQDLNEILGLEDGVVLDFEGYEIVDHYPLEYSSAFDGVNSSPGNRLLLLKFTLRNTTLQEIYVDMINTKAYFQMKVDGGARLNADVNFLEDDLMNFQGILEPDGGKMPRVVLMREYPTDTLDQLKSIILIVRKGSEEKEVKIY